MNKFIAGMVFLLILLFQNCSGGFTASRNGKISGGALNFSAPASLGSFSSANSVKCPAPGADSTPAQTADLLQGCIDRAPVNGVVELAAVTYLVQKRIVITKAILLTTAGVAESDPACLDNSAGKCAVIKATGSLLNPDYGLVQITAPTFAMRHIVVDGNRSERNSSAEAAACKNATSNRHGMNITVTNGSGHAFYRNSSINTVCGSALAFAGTTPDIEIVENFVSHAGTHNVFGLWADGITISESPNSRIVGNHVVDATDVDLILGGCTNCSIQGNRVSKTGSFEGSSFAAFMIYSWWPGTSGDYSGSTISDNVIDCANYRCGFGLLIGDLPWHPGEVKGGRVVNNTVRGAMTGIAVNDATNANNPVRIGANTVENCGGRFWSQSGEREFPAFYISETSAANVIFEGGVELANWPRDNFAGDIANWYNKDWTTSSTMGPRGPANPISAIAGTSSSSAASRAPAAPTAPVEIPKAQIRALFDLELPGCWSTDNQAYWEAWFGRGGLTKDFVITLQTERSRNASCYIRHEVPRLFNVYLPGCLTNDLQNQWETWFARGGTMAVFVQTLQTARAQSPSCVR